MLSYVSDRSPCLLSGMDKQAALRQPWDVHVALSGVTGDGS